MRMGAMGIGTAVCLAAVAMGSAAAGPAPVERTAYGKALFRLEARTATPEPDAAKRQAAEGALARAGIQARWIEMVDTSGNALLDTPYVPGPGPQAARYEADLKAWVAEIKAQGMAAMSWHPLTFNRQGYRAHPDWRQQFIEPYPIPGEEELFCCINTGYGDALIAYCVEAVKRLDLDGIWFDGSVWTGIWQRPYPLTCCCAACKTRFKRDTGMTLPTKLDWESPAFRKWAAWRFDLFGRYIGKLAAAIRAAKPTAAVAINHYHRPGIPWRSAVPLDRYEADIITGSEAGPLEQVDLTTRLCRAYGRSQSEVWRPLDVAGEPAVNAEPLVQHALAAYAAGGMPSFGGDPFNARTAPTAAVMAPIIHAIGPVAGGRSLTPVALHVSQQTETFHYARGDTPGSASAPYWSSLQAWTTALGEAHLAPEYLFDRDFAPARLAGYKAVLLPLSVSLTDAQARTALAYARSGGTLLLGCGTGTAQADGQPRVRGALEQELGYAGTGSPRPDGTDTSAALMRAGKGAAFVHEGVRKPVRFTSPAWKPMMTADGKPSMAERAYGKGRVILLDADPARTAGRDLAVGGRTTIAFVPQAASGKWAAEFGDDAVAPETYYPDMETRLPHFGLPRCTGGALEMDAWLGPDASAAVELRSSQGPLEGPTLMLSAKDGLLAQSRPVCAAPISGWFHLRVAFDFAAPGAAAAYTISVTLPDGTRREERRPCGNPAWRGMDWIVIYGAGTQKATFRIDNVLLTRRTAAGGSETAVRYDFEEGPSGASQPTLLRTVMGLLQPRIPQAVRVAAPASVRSGVFTSAAGTVRVHLHNRDGFVAGFKGAAGPEAVIVTQRPVRSARRLIRGGQAAVARRGSGSEVRVGPVGLYEVVELKQ
ncbi:MAG: beta-galactosidase trimerization domain-containing protein [Armatimonadetes bacterium]|nr:beta-galactosidase trimerization domain-containing protein [Armatimonadota bacterium]